MIFCYGENHLFPESDFIYTKEGKIFQPPIHHIQPEHWATTGIPVDPSTIPGVAAYDRAKGIIEIDIIPTHAIDVNISSIPGVLGEEEEEEGR